MDVDGQIHPRCEFLVRKNAANGPSRDRLSEEHYQQRLAKKKPILLKGRCNGSVGFMHNRSRRTNALASTSLTFLYEG